MIKEVISRLKKLYGEPKTALNYSDPFELLVATVLSAQTTDVHVNRVTERLFRKYRSVRDYADAPVDALRQDLSSVNFYNNKTRSIQGAAKMLIKEFDSKVPASMSELTRLPGVARKTANIILSVAFGINEGIAVDTHVKRLSIRLGLTGHQDPVKIEKDLMGSTPKGEWSDLSLLLICHGRQVCKARKPRHDDCVLRDICPSNDI